MKRVNLKLWLACVSIVALSACGGVANNSSPSGTDLPPVSSGDGLSGTPDQPFAQRVAQTPYPKSSLLNDPEVMKRILGPDLDQNGIRDDVDTLIGTLSKSPIEKKAFQQYARVIQHGLLAGTKAEAFQVVDSTVRSLLCFEKIATVTTTSNAEMKLKYRDIADRSASISKLTRNTLERAFRADEVSQLAHGATIVSKLNPNLDSVCD